MTRTDLDRTLDAVTARGWSIVLLGERAKFPHTAHWEITSDVTMIDRHLERGGNIGLLTSETAGVAVLDVDAPGVLAEMETALQPIGRSPWVKSRRGLHFYLRWIPNLVSTVMWRGQRLGEIKHGNHGAQHQIVLPPSEHPKEPGLRYRWLVDPAIEPLTPLSATWREHLTAHPHADAFVSPETIPEGQRNDVLYRTARSMRAKQ
jgi:hypothetical protein